MKLGEDLIEGGAPVGVGGYRMLVVEPGRNRPNAEGAIGFQENLQHSSRQRSEQVGAAAALVAHDDLAIPLAPDDRVRGNAAPVWRGCRQHVRASNGSEPWVCCWLWRRWRGVRTQRIVWSLFASPATMAAHRARYCVTSSEPPNWGGTYTG